MLPVEQIIETATECTRLLTSFGARGTRVGITSVISSRSSASDDNGSSQTQYTIHYKTIQSVTFRSTSVSTVGLHVLHGQADNHCEGKKLAESEGAGYSTTKKCIHFSITLHAMDWKTQSKVPQDKLRSIVSHHNFSIGK